MPIAEGWKRSTTPITAATIVREYRVCVCTGNVGITKERVKNQRVRETHVIALKCLSRL
jgi:hypothetical protein